ncbi:MAG: protein tyrosine phosphatase [Hyphomicrobiaceae bacterium]|nr:protein tyrosine phosphatase [Hyphomicrobiaceae bacterium]MCC0008530.1 protein tyrosine phosphatase [Hyphomicrobiaceae bacterium]
MMTTPPNTIAVCSMQRIDETIAATGATRLVSVVNAHLMPPTPSTIDPALHLRLPITDARPPRGSGQHPARPHVQALIAFIRAWPQDAPMLIHCFSGLNRSPAAAYIALAVLNPDVPETLIAYRLRAASETAAPNLGMVGLADLELGRRGHLISALELIGPGQPAAEGRPFTLSASFSP